MSQFRLNVHRRDHQDYCWEVFQDGLLVGGGFATDTATAHEAACAVRDILERAEERRQRQERLLAVMQKDWEPQMAELHRSLRHTWFSAVFVCLATNGWRVVRSGADGTGGTYNQWENGKGDSFRTYHHHTADPHAVWVRFPNTYDLGTGAGSDLVFEAPKE